MRVLIQWAQRTPRDWVEINSNQWNALPDRGVPPSGRMANPGNQQGWINQLCIQGVLFQGDHYAVRDLPDGSCEVSSWNDDPEDYPPGMFYAHVWTFRPLFQDPRIGGGWNTDQSKIIYAATDYRAFLESIGPIENAVIRPWEEFVSPSNARHGVWLTDDLYASHQTSRRRTVSWREWLT